MSKLRSLKAFFAFFALLIVLLPCLSGCQILEEKEATFNYSVIDQSQFIYDEQADKTKVIWATTLSNNSVYDIQSFEVVFNLYSGSEKVKTETYAYDVGVGHGDEYTDRFHFTAPGKIDKIEYVSWTADFSSFWNTYYVWIVVAIIAVALGIVLYTIFIFINEYDPSDVWDDILDFIWIPIIFLIVGGGSAIWGFVSSNIINVCIVAVAVISFIILALISHLIRFLICDVFYVVDFEDFFIAIADIFRKDKIRQVKKTKSGNTTRVSVSYQSDEEDEEEFDFDPDVENVEDHLDDPGALSCFTKEQLRDYCREHNISGYSKLSKEDLISLIMQSSENFAEKEQKRSPERTNDTRANKDTSGIRFSDIAGLEEAKEAFREKVILPFEHRELFEKYGKKVGGGILLYGLPGTGKTMFAEACSNELNALFIPVKCSDIKSKWYGESEDNVKKIFAKARKAEQAIIFFDEFEAIGAKRTDNADNGNNDLVPQILAEMQGVGNSNSKAVIMVIAATNKPWAIDSAFLRPGRFDEKIYIPLPDFEARRKMFELKLKGTPVDQLDFDELARVSDGFNGADITEFCEKLKMEAIKETLSSGEEHKITMKDVEKIKGKIQSSVSDEDVAELFEFEKNN